MLDLDTLSLLEKTFVRYKIFITVVAMDVERP